MATTVRFRHHVTREVCEGRLTRIFPHVNSVVVLIPNPEREVVVHHSNVIYYRIEETGRMSSRQPKVIGI